jgi:hypothetical protein
MLSLHVGSFGAEAHGTIAVVALVLIVILLWWRGLRGR